MQTPRSETTGEGGRGASFLLSAEVFARLGEGTARREDDISIRLEVASIPLVSSVLLPSSMSTATAAPPTPAAPAP
eukprot:9482497-Pyramimonas_sp.AAC.1